ncbi:MAG TPA: DNA-binding domain-containing protein [Planctomycetota bacterium]
MNGAPELGQLQQWLAFVVRHRATADVAVRAPAARALCPVRDVLAGGVVAPGERSSVTDRLQVYNGAYLARLCGVLAADYPALRHLLGSDRFDRLCAAYVERHPSRHPNLNQLGRRLPAFVGRRRDLPRRAFAAELAQLECCIALAADAPEFAPMPGERLHALPAGDWPRARLQCNPSLQLASFRHPVNAWLDDVLAARAPRAPRRRPSQVAVFRHGSRVLRLDLTPTAFAVLTAIAAGKPLGRALAQARGEQTVGTWFQDWSARGLFVGVHVAARR